jgi:hypothetical protein
MMNNNLSISLSSGEEYGVGQEQRKKAKVRLR